MYKMWVNLRDVIYSVLQPRFHHMCTKQAALTCGVGGQQVEPLGSWPISSYITGLVCDNAPSYTLATRALCHLPTGSHQNVTEGVGSGIHAAPFARYSKGNP